MLLYITCSKTARIDSCVSQKDNGEFEGERGKKVEDVFRIKVQEVSLYEVEVFIENSATVKAIKHLKMILVSKVITLLIGMARDDDCVEVVVRIIVAVLIIAQVVNQKEVFIDSKGSKVRAGKTRVIVTVITLIKVFKIVLSKVI